MPGSRVLLQTPPCVFLTRFENSQWISQHGHRPQARPEASDAPPCAQALSPRHWCLPLPLPAPTDGREVSPGDPGSVNLPMRETTYEGHLPRLDPYHQDFAQSPWRGHYDSKAALTKPRLGPGPSSTLFPRFPPLPDTGLRAPLWLFIPRTTSAPDPREPQARSGVPGPPRILPEASPAERPGGVQGPECVHVAMVTAPAQV